jgi:hypothetical protein
MSKLSVRLFVVVVLLIIQGTLLVCEDGNRWNSSFALSMDHPFHRAISWIIRRVPIPLSTIQRLAQALLVAEAVIVLNFFFKVLCSFVILLFQGLMMSVAIGLVYQISQQDLHTTFLNFRTAMEQLFYRYIANSMRL